MSRCVNDILDFFLNIHSSRRLIRSNIKKQYPNEFLKAKTTITVFMYTVYDKIRKDYHNNNYLPRFAITLFFFFVNSYLFIMIIIFLFRIKSFSFKTQITESVIVIFRCFNNFILTLIFVWYLETLKLVSIPTTNFICCPSLVKNLNGTLFK